MVESAAERRRREAEGRQEAVKAALRGLRARPDLLERALRSAEGSEQASKILRLLARGAGVPAVAEPRALAAPSGRRFAECPTVSFERPPRRARMMYKVLAKMNGGFYSVYDGLTEYREGMTLTQEAEEGHGGGIYVYNTANKVCLRPEEDTFPSSSALMHSPKVLARCWCWNLDPKASPLTYNDKLAFDCVHVAEILEHPAERARNQRALDELQIQSILSLTAADL